MRKYYLDKAFENFFCKRTQGNGMAAGRIHGIFKIGCNRAWCQKLFLWWETFLSPFLGKKVMFRKVKNWFNLLKVTELDSNKI